MDQTVEQNLRSTNHAAEKLRRDRAGQGAEQLTPERRASLLERGESLRRQITAVEAKRTRDQERQRMETEAEQTDVQRLGAALKREMKDIARKVAAEGTELQRVSELLSMQEEKQLRAEEEAVRIDLASGTTHEAAAPYHPEEAVLETSPNLTPDLRKEATGQSEKSGADIPSAN